MPATEGTVLLGMRAVSGPPASAVTIFQDYERALLPWRTVRRNVALDLEGRRGVPWRLSGGMQQRAQIVRALALRPQALLMAGDGSIGAPLLSVGKPSVFGSVWAAQSGWAQAHMSVIQRWTSSLVQAECFIKADPTGARAILQKYTQLPVAVADAVQLPAYSASMSAAALKAEIAPWEQALKRSGQFSAQIPADQFVSATAGP